MRKLRGFGRRAGALLLAVTMTFATVPPVGARDSVLGTITVIGPAFAASSTKDWVKITAVRPLVSDDRLRTGSGGSLVADFGPLGIVGLYGNSELAVTERGDDVVVDAQRGKVAFQLPVGSRLKVAARGSEITAGAVAAGGYVEFNAEGAPELFVESDNLTIVLAGGTAKTLARGDRLVLTGIAATAPAAAAGTGDARKAGAVPATQEVRKKRRRISPLGWTAIGALVIAVGVGAGVGLSGGGGGGGGDSNGSE